MAVIPIRPEMLAAELRARMKQTPEVVNRGLRLGAERGRSRMVRITPRDLGQARNSWRVRVVPKGSELVNDAPHIGILEKGARPHPVSREGIEALTRWALRKIDLSSSKDVHGPVQRGKGGRSALVKSARQQMAEGVAHAIAWKLRHHGQKPTYFIRNEMDRLTTYAKQEVDRVVRIWSAERAKGSK